MPARSYLAYPNPNQDDFEWSKVKYFVLYVLAFSLGTWTNMKVLQTANVETVIVFRSCCPIVVAGFDYIFYGRACPSLRSVASLLLITGGAVGYILNDKEFQNSGWVAYYWVMIWWTVLVLQLTYGPDPDPTPDPAPSPDPASDPNPDPNPHPDQVLIFQLTYGKFLVSGLPLKSLWTPVLYTNTLSVLPAMLVGIMAGELSQARLQSIQLTNAALFWLLTSCVVGICISWAGFLCQSLVTATSYTVVGVMNKMLTVTARQQCPERSSAALASATAHCTLASLRPALQAPRLRDALGTRHWAARAPSWRLRCGREARPKAPTPSRPLHAQVNVLIWDKHASVSGIFSLALCLVGGSLYQQAPPRVEGPEGEYLKRPGSHTEESEEELEPVPVSRR